jgi:hypothetical protein
MKAYGGVDVYTHVFLTSAQVGGEWSALRPSRFTPGERAGLDDVEKILGSTGTRTPIPHSSNP